MVKDIPELNTSISKPTIRSCSAEQQSRDKQATTLVVSSSPFTNAVRGNLPSPEGGRKLERAKTNKLSFLLTLEDIIQDKNSKTQGIRIHLVTQRKNKNLFRWRKLSSVPTGLKFLVVAQNSTPLSPVETFPTFSHSVKCFRHSVLTFKTVTGLFFFNFFFISWTQICIEFLESWIEGFSLKRKAPPSLWGKCNFVG